MVDGYQVCDWLLVMVLPYLFFGWPGSCFVVGVARCVFLVGLNRPFRLENSLPQRPPSRVPRVWSLPRGQDVLAPRLSWRPTGIHPRLSCLAVLFRGRARALVAAPWS